MSTVPFLAVPQMSPDFTSLETNNEYDERSIFLGDIPPGTMVSDLEAIFVDLPFFSTEIKVINGAKGSVAYAFITFISVEVAQIAIDKFKECVVFPCGTQARMGWAKRNCRLHVSNLDQNTVEEDLVGLFAKCESAGRCFIHHALPTVHSP